MNFDFSEDQNLLKKAARDFLDDRSSLARVREIFESDAPYDRDLWSSAAEMGWMGTAVPESLGGAGFGHLELAVIAEEIGRALAPFPVSSSVYLATEGLLAAGTPEQKERHVPGLASGDRIGTLAASEGPGVDRGFETLFRDGRVHGTKLPVPDGDVADVAIVAARDPETGPCLVIVSLDGDGVKRQSLRSIDPARSQARIDFEGAAGERLGAPGEGEALLERLYDRAAVLMAFEQLGGAQRCLDLAREFAMQRYAFGRPIGSFQAIKHKLADLFVAVELARSNCYYGAWALSSGSDELPLAACLARISATEAYELCSQENVQVHGGVGFTWEYDCHLFLRRSKLLSLALGSPSVWKRLLIRRLEQRDAD